MKTYFFAFLALVIATSIPLTAHAVEVTKSKAKIELLDEAAMQRLGGRGTSSTQHEILPALVGDWSFDLKYWSKKDAEPQLSMGTVKNEMVLGDRFLSSKASVMLNIGGQNIPYEGLYLLGYDTIKKSYTSVLADTMHTGITTGLGQYNEKLKTLDGKGSFTNPLMDKEHAYRSELQVEGSDTYKLTFFIPDIAGKEFKVLELSFRRKM
jgi:hypothetical protein